MNRYLRSLVEGKSLPAPARKAEKSTAAVQARQPSLHVTKYVPAGEPCELIITPSDARIPTPVARWKPEQPEEKRVLRRRQRPTYSGIMTVTHIASSRWQAPKEVKRQQYCKPHTMPTREELAVYSARHGGDKLTGS